jgi:hypothetical protein
MVKVPSESAGDGVNRLSRREVGLFLPIYVGFAFINLRVKLWVTPAWVNGTLKSNHGRLLAFSYTNNEQSRILQWGIPELLIRVFGLSVADAYLLQRFLFVAATFAAFHGYMRRWFTKEAAFAGVATFAACMPFTYFNHLQESAPLLMLTFLLGLFCIRDERPGLFALVLFLGALNNETMLAMPALYVLVGFSVRNMKAFFMRCASAVALVAPAVAWTIFIRWHTRDRPHLGDPYQLLHNLRSIKKDLLVSPFHWWHATFLYPVFIFGVLWLYMLFGRKPSFIHRTVWFIPIFIFPHLITGIISEVRQLLPLGFIVIPAAWCFLFEKYQSGTEKKKDNIASLASSSVG